jgi:hypothetical protein
MGCLLWEDGELWTLPADWLSRLESTDKSLGLTAIRQLPFHQCLPCGFDCYSDKQWNGLVEGLLDHSIHSAHSQMERFNCRSRDGNSTWVIILQCLDRALKVVQYTMTDMTPMHQENTRFSRAVSASNMALFDIDVPAGVMHFFASSDCAEILNRPAEKVQLCVIG